MDLLGAGLPWFGSGGPSPVGLSVRP